MSLRERLSAAAEVDAFMSKKKAFSTYPREDLIELYADAFMKGYMQCAEKRREWRKEIEAERDAAVAAAHTAYDNGFRDGSVPCVERLAFDEMEKERNAAIDVVKAAIRLRDSIMTDSDPLIDDVQVSGLLTSLEAYERAKLGK